MKIITPATVEPITLAQARKQCKVDPEGSPPVHEDDELISIFLTAAREWCESYLGSRIAPTLVEIAFDAFPSDVVSTTTVAGTLALQSSPVLAINGITYLDADGFEQTLDPIAYTLDTTTQVAVARLNVDETWPATQAVANAVTVRYTIGYSLSGDSPQAAPLPSSIKVAILLILGHLYEHREDVSAIQLYEVPLGAKALLSPLKVRQGFV